MPRGWDIPPQEAAISLSIEAAEVLEHFQFMKSKKMDVDAIGEEVADVIIYMMEMCDKLGIDVSEAVERKLKKIDIKYPIKELKEKGSKYYYSQKRKYRTGE
jgi:NTP pyrophosphatase (non-canonical NTP hydrolase)